MASSPSPVRAAASVDVGGLLQDLDSAASDAERATFFATMASNADLQVAVLHSLVVAEADMARTRKSLETMPGVLDMLLRWYRVLGITSSSGTTGRQHMVLQYLPVIIEANFVLRASNANRKICKTIDSFLLSIYNSQVADRAGQPHETAIRLHNLAQGSIYHDGARVDLDHVSGGGSGGGRSGGPGSLELTLRLYRQATRVTGQNRMTVSEALLRAFNANVGELTKHFLDQSVRAYQRLLQRGHGVKATSSPRVALAPNVLLEMLYGAYFCIYNGLQMQGAQVVELIKQRASSQASPGLLLTVNAVKTLVLNSGPSQLPSTSITTPSQIAKNMITNASFRAKKMGDDIPKVENEAAVAAGNTGVPATNAAGPGGTNDMANNIKALANMTSISEEILEEMAEKPPSYAIAAAGGKEKEKEKSGNVAKNLVEASAKSIVESSKISKEKLAKAKAKLNIRKRMDSEKDPEKSAFGSSGGSVELTAMKKSDKQRMQLQISAVDATSDGNAVSVRDAPLSAGVLEGGGGGGILGGGSRKKSSIADKLKQQLPSSSSSTSPAASATLPTSAPAGGSVGGGGGSSSGGATPPMLQTTGNNGEAVYSGGNVSASEIDSMEQVEALIQQKKLPPETVAIHSPESGTTIF